MVSFCQFPFVCEYTIRPETHPLSLLCHGFDNHHKSSYLCLARFNGRWFAFCIFGHKQSSILVVDNRLSICRVPYSSISVPVTSVPFCCWVPCRHHCPARCRVDSIRDTPVRFPNSCSKCYDHSFTCCESNVCPTCVPTFHTFVTNRHLVLDPTLAPDSVNPTFVTIRQLNLCDRPSSRSEPHFHSHFLLSCFPPSPCSLRCLSSSTDNSHIVSSIELLPPCPGLDCA